ncbi:MAG: tRNA pseudouridine(38-40) synthase TruA [Oscillospiraceae bacterium]|nr:tRNA pseudouridine(38-40) synthase TruA [Oscillospiraceae bacterium]
MRNIALTLRFDGSDYHGWQMQPALPTVCGAVAGALEPLCGHKVKLIGCGRTDAGVHAERYVANFRSETRIPDDRLPFALNAKLPPDICALEARTVPDGFHAAFSCVRKEYTYRLYNRPHRDPLLRRRALFWPYAAEYGLWREAAAGFVGTHDFAAVRSQGTPVKSTVRTVYYFEVEREGPDMYLFRVCANGFLYNMARAMVGTVLYGGLGKLGDVPSLLAGGNRSAAGPTVPAHGLYMTDIWYN